MATHRLDKTDFPGILAETALSYRSMIEDGVRRAADGPRKQASPKDLSGLVPILAACMSDAEEVFAKLEHLVADRTSAPCPERESTYFGDVLPYNNLPKCKANQRRVFSSPPGYNGPKSAKTLVHDVWLSGDPWHAYQAAKDLVTCPQFLNTIPGEWPEQSIFKKEDKHATQVNSDPAFITERSRFFRDYKEQIPSTSEVIFADADLPEEIAQRLESAYSASETLSDEFVQITESLDDKQSRAFERFQGTLNPDQAIRLQALCTPQDVGIESIPVNVRWKYDLALICRKYALDGFSKANVVAQRFRIKMEKNTAVVVIPNFIRFDARRDLPSAVLNMFRQRERSDLEWYPQQRFIQNPSLPIPDKRDEEFERDAKDLMNQWARRKIRTKGEVHELLREKHALSYSRAKDEHEQLRQIRRVFKRLGLTWPTHS